jgi:oligoendopeptidase F
LHSIQHLILTKPDFSRSIHVTEIRVPTREEVTPEYTWNDTSLFKSVEVWKKEFDDIPVSLAKVEGYKGRLAQGPEVLLQALEAIDEIVRRAGKVIVYAVMSHAVDTNEQGAAGRYGQAQSLYSRVIASTAFLQPELLEIGEDLLGRWIEEEPRLAIYGHHFEDLFRKVDHVRSAEVEELLGMLEDPFAGTSGTARMLTNADFKFKPASSLEGDDFPLTQGTYSKIRTDPDRQLRQSAWENYLDLYREYKNTLAQNLITSIKQNVFKMRARNHASTLEAALHQDNIPVEVFHNLIDTFKANLPTWHRYWAIRRKALGVEELHPYDIWAPLTKDRPVVLYPQAVEWIVRGLTPMGEEYVEILQKGCTVDRWVDVYPNEGKRAGAFSTGSKGTFPFIMMSYNDTVFSLSTLAHELGHSMHSYFAWENQPMVYSDYSLFVAEVASNFHQAMVRAYLLENMAEPVFQISMIEEAMSNFHRYFLIMPTLARFELEMHEAVEREESVTAERMIERCAELFAEAYGSEMEIDRERVGMLWATFGHLYVDYYVFQYATGISGAHSLSRRILSGEEGAVEDYLNFLKAGGSVYPIEALKLAGVDLTKPDAVEETFQVMAGMVDRLEQLVG